MNNERTSWAAFFCVPLACSGALAQEVYKSIDAQGRTIYSDRPLSHDAERVNTPQPARNAETGQASATEAPESQSLAAMKKMLADREAQIAETEAAAAKKSEEDEAKAALCKKARSEYYEFADGQARFHLDDAGNRVAYTFAELAAQRQSTQQQMEQACAAP